MWHGGNLTDSFRSRKKLRVNGEGQGMKALKECRSRSVEEFIADAEDASGTSG